MAQIWICIVPTQREDVKVNENFVYTSTFLSHKTIVPLASNSLETDNIFVRKVILFPYFNKCEIPFDLKKSVKKEN